MQSLMTLCGALDDPSVHRDCNFTHTHGRMMNTLDQYQEAATSFAIYDIRDRITYPALGLASEAGEVCNHVKKRLRDGKMDFEKARDELGDVLWYVAVLANDLGISLSSLANRNIQKLSDRKNRGVIGGSGDNR